MQREGAEPDSTVADLADGKPVFLTAIDQEFPEPGRIDADHELRATAEGTPYRRTVHRDELLTVGDGIPVWLLTVGAAVAVIASAAYALTFRRLRRAAGPTA
ncbi:hypothetical protein [Streptomyces sp. NPDC090021]|uniref:hypothetical protein n=1 Tax=Streptomyces sp. NPDC090021 TaxID=3365919 RepID=UPI0038080588